MYWNGLWRVPGLKELNKENENEGQKKAETSGERRPMAGAAMLAHFKELSSMKQKLRLSIHINPWTINSSRLRLLSERASARLALRHHRALDTCALQVVVVLY
jgi:hypothetical protein